jgi:hypothetical protein
VSIHVVRKLLRDLNHLRKVGVAVLPRRRPNRNENNIGSGHSVRELVRKCELTASNMSTKQVPDPFLENGAGPTLEQPQCCLVDINANDSMSEFGQTNACDQSNVPCSANHTDS